jgi:transcription-repair coupling factor (superfamily II helicase)
MTIEDLHSAFLDRPEIKAAIKELKRGGETHLLLSGLHASARALAIEAMIRSSEYRVFFVVIDNEEDAKYLYADLKKSSENKVFFFPSSKRRRTTDEAMVIQRTECLAALRKPTPSPSLKGREECTVYGVGCKEDKSQEAMIIVTYPEAINETEPAQKHSLPSVVSSQ